MPRLLPTRCCGTLALLAAAATACGMGSVDPGGGEARAKDSRIRWLEARPKDAASVADLPAAGDGPGTTDLTVKVGDPCTSGKCGAGLICMANVCWSMCTRVDKCNSVVSPCGPAEACMWASDFSDACYPASATAGQPCDNAKGIYCVGGTLCVQPGQNAPRCLKTCPGGSGCPAGVQCVSTSNNCHVCLQL